MYCEISTDILPLCSTCQTHLMRGVSSRGALALLPSYPLPSCHSTPDSPGSTGFVLIRSYHRTFSFPLYGVLGCLLHACIALVPALKDLSTTTMYECWRRRRRRRCVRLFCSSRKCSPLIVAWLELFARANPPNSGRFINANLTFLPLTCISSLRLHVFMHRRINSLCEFVRRKWVLLDEAKILVQKQKQSCPTRWAIQIISNVSPHSLFISRSSAEWIFIRWRFFFFTCSSIKIIF